MARVGSGSQCATRSRSIRTDRERVADADAARAWLQSQSWVAPDRVALLGWSSGAITALWAVRARTQPPPQSNDGPDFRSAVALYPGCRRLSNAAWSARVPTLDFDRARRRPGLGRDLPADGGRRAGPQRPGRDPRLSRRASRFRPSEPAATAAHWAGVFDGRQRPRAQRHQSGRPRRRAQARARVVWSVIVLRGGGHAAGRDI